MWTGHCSREYAAAHIVVDHLVGVRADHPEPHAVRGHVECIVGSLAGAVGEALDGGFEEADAVTQRDFAALRESGASKYCEGVL
jgi:hypothetical protein